MTKIDIISGFLGAGKTTLIKKLLQDAFAGEQVVLIENEFGEIGIDGGFLKDAGIEVTEMNSGCICCSLVGDFETALKDVLDKFHPDRIIIEPSGVGKLSDVINAVKNVDSDKLILNSFTAVVDGIKTRMYMKNFGEFYNNQIENARTIIISRTQNLSDEKLENCVTQLREHNDKAVIITTPWDHISGKQILEAIEQTSSLAEEVLSQAVCPECGHVHDEHHEHHHHEHSEECCHHGHEHHHEHSGECCHHEHGHEHGHHHADDVFTSWGVETPHKYKKEEIEKALKVLSETEEYGVVLRAKGMVPDVNGSWIYFDLVPGEYELRDGEPEYTGRLCVIGTELQEDKLKTLFLL